MTKKNGEWFDGTGEYVGEEAVGVYAYIDNGSLFTTIRYADNRFALSLKYKYLCEIPEVPVELEEGAWYMFDFDEAQGIVGQYKRRSTNIDLSIFRSFDGSYIVAFCRNIRKMVPEGGDE